MSAYISLLIASAFFGGNIIANRVVAQFMPPVFLAFTRGLLGLMILLPFAWGHLRRGPRPTRRDWLRFLLFGFIGIAFPYITLVMGMKETSATNASIILATCPAVTITLLAVGWRVIPSRLQIMGVITSFLGLLLIFANGSLEHLLSFRLNASDFLLVLNVISVSIFTILGQTTMEKYSPLVTSVYSLFFGILFMIPITGWELYSTSWHLPWYGWFIVGYMGFLVTGIALLLNLQGIHRIGSSKASIFTNLSPVFGIVLGTVLLGEELYSYHWAGIFLVFAGVILSLSKDYIGYLSNFCTNYITRITK